MQMLMVNFLWFQKLSSLVTQHNAMLSTTSTIIFEKHNPKTTNDIIGIQFADEMTTTKTDHTSSSSSVIVSGHVSPSSTSNTTTTDSATSVINECSNSRQMTNIFDSELRSVQVL
jgi:hypothetical protein